MAYIRKGRPEKSLVPPRRAYLSELYNMMAIPVNTRMDEFTYITKHSKDLLLEEIKQITMWLDANSRDGNNKYDEVKQRVSLPFNKYAK